MTWARPRWYTGDSTELGGVIPGQVLPGAGVDLIFTCPPYYDLEQYSDDPRDLSNARDYQHFMDLLKLSMSHAVARLKPNRFAVIVMGEVGDPAGFNRGLVADTVKLMQDLGLGLYSEAILLTPVGSLPVRAGYHFRHGRKLERAHQHVLVFYKGDVSKIKLAFSQALMVPDLEVDDEPEA